MIEEVYHCVLAKQQLIHCITNAVTANDLANVLLAIGASPIMAEAQAEVAEVTAQSAGLYLNLGILSQARLDAMCEAGKTARRLKIPVLFDMVGVGVSEFRSRAAQRILEEVKPTVLRGNCSEFNFLLHQTSSTLGVDANSTFTNVEEVQKMGKRLQQYAEQHEMICALSGATDIVADAKRVYLIYNGVPVLRQITGSGCMLSGLNTAFIAANKERALEATLTAFCFFGLCGEMACERMARQAGGTASFRNGLIDAVSLMTETQFKEGARYECLI